MNYHLVTLGCAKNTVDSMRLERALRNGRHVPVDTPEAADLLLVNTCGFIDAAKEESVEVVRGLEAQRRPGQRIFVVGCMTEIAAAELTSAVPGVDRTFGVEAWDAIAAEIGPADAAFDIPRSRHVTDAPLSAAPSAYLKISDGCDRPCTFCIIPSIKGRMHSDPTERLEREARWLTGSGVRELVLVAQDSTAYGEDQGDRDGLATLLERLSAAAPSAWLRLMYAYPGRVTPRLAETMASLPNVVPYLDMPLQHGSDAVLRRMRRPSLRTARRSLDTIRAALPDVTLRTTFIVGFPGETEAEFQELLDFVAEQQFDHVGAFTYSPQPGTAAAVEPDQVPEPVKQERYGRLMELAQGISHERNRAPVGREFEVLNESDEPAETADGAPISIGRTVRDAPEVDGLAFVKGIFPAGELVRARVEAALPYDLICRPVAAAGGAEPVEGRQRLTLHPRPRR